jgi:predicted transcriptional regulator
MATRKGFEPLSLPYGNTLAYLCGSRLAVPTGIEPVQTVRQTVILPLNYGTSMKKDKQEKAIELRRQGLSLNEISKELDVAKSSVSLWVRHVKLNADAVNALKDKNPIIRGSSAFAKSRLIKHTHHRDSRIKMQLEGAIKARSGDILHAKGCMLYWAEGTKSRNSLVFTNTDENMLKLFLKFLKESLNVNKDDIYLEINFHSGDEKDISKYWTDTLSIIPRRLKKIKPRGNGTFKKNKHYMGIAVIVVKKSTKYCQHIYGAIQEYAGFSNEMCLY